MKILALDMGTSSVRGLVLDSAAVPLPGALARRKVTLTVAADGTATLDGLAYLAALGECLDELTTDGHLDGVELVATSAQWHSTVPLDRAGRPLGPVLTWLDTRAAPVDPNAGPADQADFHRRTGTWWHRGYWSVRLPWLRENSGTTPSRFGGLVEVVLGALLDDAPMSISQASGTGMLDLWSMDWDREARELAGVPRGGLPALAPADWWGTLRAEYAQRWPALVGARWAPVTGDGAAANVGSGCVGPDRAAVTVGTSAAVRLIHPLPDGAEPPTLPLGLWRYRVDRRRIVTGAAYSAGGNLFAWARRELRLPAGAELEAALDRLMPGRSITADPRFGGDRPPGLAPAGSGRIAGIGFRTTSVDLLAGLMNALCQQVAVDLVDLESTACRPVEVVLGGGAVAASGWWRRAFQAALAPRRVGYVGNPEIGAIGAARVAIGRFDGGVGVEPISRTDRATRAATTG